MIKKWDGSKDYVDLISFFIILLYSINTVFVSRHYYILVYQKYKYLNKSLIVSIIHKNELIDISRFKYCIIVNIINSRIYF